METFTLFIILPTEEVCSLRHLVSGITIRDVRCKLEMLAGLPAQTYRLVGTDEKILHEDQDLILGKNVWDGFILRVQLLNSWQPIYDAIVQDNIAWILEHGAVHLRDFRVQEDHDEEGDDREKEVEKTRRVIGERGGVALFMACWSGKDKMCRALLKVGVDPNSRTPFRRSPIFACVARDNDRILETMLTHGAKMSAKDCFGDTAMEVAKRNFARLCVNRMRSFQLMSRNRNSPRPKSPSNSSVSDTPRSEQIRQGGVASPRPASRVKSARTNRGRVSVTENRTIVNDRKYVDQNSMAREGSLGDYPTRAQLFQMSPRAMTSVTQSSPRHSSLTSSSPRGKGEFLDRGSRTTRTASGVQFRLAIPQTNSTQSKSKNVVTWDHPLTNTEFLTVGITKGTQNHGHQTRESWMHNNRKPGTPRNGLITDTSISKGTTISEITDLSSPRSSGIGNAHDISIDVRSVESAPQSQVSGDRSYSREVTVPHYLSERPSARTRRQMKASQKKSQTLSTAKRRIQLSEQLKLDAKRRESFEQWLRRKRIQQLKDQSRKSMDGSSSDDDREDTSTAFNDWLKQVKERPIHKPNPNSAVSLHQRKTRALQGLIEIGDTSPPESRVVAETDVSSYMHSYQDWLKKRTEAKYAEEEPTVDTDSAKKALESKRLDLLAMAVSFDEWMAYNEERKKVMREVEKEDKNHLKDVGGKKQQSDDSGLALTFDQWKQQVEAKDARMKLKQLRIRQRQELERQLRNSHRNSASVPHDEWLKKKMQQSQLQQRLNQQLQQQHERAKSAVESKRSPDRAFQSWVNAKQDQEMHRLDTGIRKEKQLLLQLREKKHVTISC